MIKNETHRRLYMSVLRRRISMFSRRNSNVRKYTRAAFCFEVKTQNSKAVPTNVEQILKYHFTIEFVLL